MNFSKFTALILAAAANQAYATLVNTTGCTDIHFILARGTTESYPGSTYSLAELIYDNLTVSANYEDIIYPAVDETTSDSYFIGRAAVGSQVTNYTTSCPDSRIVLISYSQGAMIVGDALAGGGGNSILGNTTEPLISEEVSKHIAAIVFYGNPRHVPYEPYDFGTALAWNVTGKYPRSPYQIKYLNERITNVTADWCNVGDSVCSPSEGADALSLHTAYTEDYNTVAAEWVLARLSSGGVI